MNSIKKRLLFSIILITIIPVIAFMFYALTFVSPSAKDSEFSLNESKIEWSGQYLDTITNRLDESLYSLHLKPDLLQLVDDSVNDTEEIESTIRDFVYTNANIIKSISIVSINSNREVTFDYQSGFQSFYSDYDNEIIALANEPIGIEFFLTENSIQVLHTINDFSTMQLQGVISVTLHDGVVSEIDNIYGKNQPYVLFTNDGILHNPDSLDISYIQENLDSSITSVQSFDNGDSFSWVVKDGSSNIYVASILDKAIVNSFSSSLITIGLITIFVSLVTSVIMALLFTNSITYPITKLVNHMKKVNLEIISTEDLPYSEIEVLVYSYNQMILEINQLIMEKYTQEIAKQKSQLKALQAQINPHFLANTFQLIGGMALYNDNPNIYDATIKMSNFIRYSTNFKDEEATLQEELIHIKDYLDIQKLRFGDNFDFTVDVHDEILKYKIPFLTLQPILENAFKHGLKKQTGIWSIRVHSEMTDPIKIIIDDNGKGIRETEINYLNSIFNNNKNDDEYPKSKKKGIGLTNIDSRIKLLHGINYGLEIIKNVNDGARIIINLPKRSNLK